MLPGLTSLEFGRLRLSIGYGTHRRSRPLSPIEVAKLLQSTCSSGASLEECAKALSLHETNIRRFLRILQLPTSLQYLVSWGSAQGTISFSVAVELCKVPNSDQTIVATAAIEHNFNSKEVRQVAQLQRRSSRPLDDCIAEVVGMRPVVENRHVFFGVSGLEPVSSNLRGISQERRESLLRDAIDELGVSGITGHLGDQLFTLVGGDALDQLLSRLGREVVEARIQQHLAEGVKHAIKQD